ncbi:MAG: hypothetical protein C0412_19235 [Flavobacterium sp.]|nr:hypothetical protein [Flavobacterium sp.]
MMFKTLIFITLLFWQFSIANCQNNNEVEVVCERTEGIIHFTFLNNTKDTLYLFSGYFDDYCPSSKYLHRINLDDKIYKISFVPLIPYVSFSLADRIILGDKRVISIGQVTYEFISLPPSEDVQLNIKSETIFSNDEKENNVIKDFELIDLNYRKLKRIKYYTSKELKGEYKLFFEFAIYQDVSFVNRIKIYGENLSEAYEYTSVSCFFNTYLYEDDK